MTGMFILRDDGTVRAERTVLFVLKLLHNVSELDWSVSTYSARAGPPEGVLYDIVYVKLVNPVPPSFLYWGPSCPGKLFMFSL